MHLPTSKKRGRPTGGAALASPIAADPASPVSDATRGAGSSANSSSPIHAAAPQPPPAQPPAASDTFKRPRSARRGLLPAGAAAAPTTAASEASGSNGTEEANPQSRIKSRLLLPAYYLRGLLASIIVPADAAPSEKQGGPWTKFVTLFLGVPHGGSAGASAGLPPPLVGSRPSSLRLPARPPASPAPSRSNASVWDEEDDENEEQQQAQQEPGQGSEQERAPSSPSPSTQPSPATAAAEQEQQQRGAEWWGEVPGIAEEIMGGLDVKGLARLGQTCRALKLAADAFASYVVRKDFPLVPVGPRALGATFADTPAHPVASLLHLQALGPLLSRQQQQQQQQQKPGAPKASGAVRHARKTLTPPFTFPTLPILPSTALNATTTDDAVTPHMRSILVDWLVEAALEFRLPHPLLPAAVALLDRALAAFKFSLPRAELQLLGCVCLLLASRRRSRSPTPLLRVPALVFIADGQYDAAQVVGMLRRVLATGAFGPAGKAAAARVPEDGEEAEEPGEALLAAAMEGGEMEEEEEVTAVAFLGAYRRLGRAEPGTEEGEEDEGGAAAGGVFEGPEAPACGAPGVDETAVLAQFLCDLALLDDQLSLHYHPSTLAAAALLLARATAQQLAALPLYVTKEHGVIHTHSREALSLHPNRRPFIPPTSSSSSLAGEGEEPFGLVSLRAFLRASRAEAAAVASCAFRLRALLQDYHLHALGVASAGPPQVLLPHPFIFKGLQDKYATTAATTDGRGLAWRAGGLVPREALAGCVERHLSLRCVPISQGGGRVSPVMILSSSSAQGCGQAVPAASVGAKRQQREQQEEEGWAAMCEVSP